MVRVEGLPPSNAGKMPATLATPTHPGYDSVMSAKAGIQDDFRPPMTGRLGLDRCLHRDDRVPRLRVR